MVNLVSRISKGTRMDQVYLPKSRPPGFGIGDFVEIVPTKRKKKNFYGYKVGWLGPVKSLISGEVFDYFEEVDNVIITGSFLEEGFGFGDVDVVLVDGIKEEKGWRKHFRRRLGLEVHFICLDRRSLMKGLKQDPLFQMMISKYVSKKREIFKFKNEFNYKLLDLHLLKSKELLNSFDVLTGKEKYDLTRNLVAIKLFLKKKRLSKDLADREIEKIFGKGMAEKLGENMAERGRFLKKFGEVYGRVFDEVMEGVKNEPKQE